MGQLFLVSFQQLTKGFDYGLTFGKAFALPLYKGIAGLANGRIHIFKVSAFTIPDCLTGDRLDRFEYRPMALQPEPVDKQFTCQLCHFDAPPGTELL